MLFRSIDTTDNKDEALQEGIHSILENIELNEPLEDYFDVEEVN